MKCIKNVSTGKIDRVDDKTASAKVDSGKFTYSSKEEWKKSTRKKVVETEEVKSFEGKALEVIHGQKAKDRRKSNKKKK